MFGSDSGVLNTRESVTIGSTAMASTARTTAALPRSPPPLFPEEPLLLGERLPPPEVRAPPPEPCIDGEASVLGAGAPALTPEPPPPGRSSGLGGRSGTQYTKDTPPPTRRTRTGGPLGLSSSSRKQAPVAAGSDAIALVSRKSTRARPSSGGT